MTRFVLLPCVASLYQLFLDLRIKVLVLLVSSLEYALFAKYICACLDLCALTGVALFC